MKKQALKNTVWLAAVVLLCAGLLAMPTLYGRWCDARLVKNLLPRPAVEGALSPQAQQFPVLNALYCRRYLSDAYLSCQNYDQKNDPQVAEQVKALGKAVEELEAAGVLTGSAARQIRQGLDKAPLTIAAWEKEGGFSGIMVSVPNADQGPVHCSLERLEEAGQITSFSCGIRETPECSAQQILECYRNYLGLSELGDWVQRSTEDGRQMGLWSECGQVYLFYSGTDAQTPYFTIGAFSVSPENFEASYLNGSAAQLPG